LTAADVLVIALVTAVVAMNWLVSRPSSPQAAETVLVADLHNAGSDLQRILTGIVLDEGGRISASNGNLLAFFTHAGAAVHAAQRMLSNVDALRQRLERDVQISIGVDGAPAAAAALQKLARDRRIAVLIGGATVARLGSTSLVVAVVDERERLFSFATAEV
jgi:hypothetical protein